MITLNCVRLIIRYSFRSHFLQRSIYICRTYKFLTSYFSHCAVWILCVISLERAAVTKHYVFTQNVFSRKHSYCTLIFIYAILFFLNIHYLIFFGSNPERLGFPKTNETDKQLTIICASNLVRKQPNSYEYFLVYYFSWMDFFINSLIPFLIILIANTSVMYSVCKTHIGMKQLGIRQTRSHRDTQLAYILFVSTFLFLLLTFPLRVFSVIEPYLKYDAKYLILLDGIMRFLLYLDHGCGFYLYTFTGELFRRELRKFVCHCLSKFCRRQYWSWTRVDSRRFSELSYSNAPLASNTYHSPTQPVQCHSITSSNHPIATNNRAMKLPNYSVKTKRFCQPPSYHQCMPAKSLLNNPLTVESALIKLERNPSHQIERRGLVKRHSSSCFESNTVHLDRERNSDIV